MCYNCPCALIFTRACTGAEREVCSVRVGAELGGESVSTGSGQHPAQWSTSLQLVNTSLPAHWSTQLQFVNSKWTPRGTICCFESPQNLLAPLQSGVVLNLVGDSVIAKRAIGAGVLTLPLSPCHDHVIGEGGGVQAEKRSTRVNPMPGTTRQLPVILHSHVSGDM